MSSSTIVEIDVQLKIYFYPFKFQIDFQNNLPVGSNPTNMGIIGLLLMYYVYF